MKIQILALMCLLMAAPNGASAQSPAPNPVPRLKKVLWIWLENTPYSTTSTQKYLKSLWQKYPSARFTKFLPVSKITQANAVAMIAGNDQNLTDNELTRLQVPTLAELLEAKNIPWRVYAEDYPGSCFIEAGSGEYKRYRVPFMSLSHIQSDRYLCSKVVTFRNLAEDMLLGQMPQFAVVIPNLKNSGATSTVGDADYTVKKIIDPIVTNPDLLDQITIIVSTINNADLKRPEMYALVLGRGVASVAQTVSTPYNHYHLLRTIEDGLRLGHLNQNDSKADPMLGFWGE